MSSSKSKYWEQQVSKFQSGQRKSNAFPFFTVMIWWVGCVARMRFPLLFLCVNHMTPCEPPERGKKKNHPELYDVQEGVVVACCGCQHLGFLSLDADQIVLQDRRKELGCQDHPLALKLVCFWPDQKLLKVQQSIYFSAGCYKWLRLYIIYNYPYCYELSFWIINHAG